MSACSALSAFAYLWAATATICSASTPITSRLPNLTLAIDFFDASISSLGSPHSLKVLARGRSLDLTLTSLTDAKNPVRAATKPEPELIYSADFNQRFDFISAFSPTHIVSDPASRVIDVRSVETLEVRFRSDILESEPDFAMISDDGSTLLTALDEENVQLWNVDTGERFNMPRIGRLTWAWLSNDGRYVLRLTQDARMQMWDIREGKPIFQKSVGREQFGMISPDNARIVTQGLAEGVSLWNAQSGELVATLEGQTLNQYAFSPDGTKLLTFSPAGDANIWSSHDGGKNLSLRHIEARVTQAAFSGDSKFVAVVYAISQEAELGRTSVYSIEDGQKKAEIQNTSEYINHIEFGADSSIVYMVENWRKLISWDVSANSLTRSMDIPVDQHFYKFLKFDKFLTHSSALKSGESLYYLYGFSQDN